MLEEMESLLREAGVAPTIIKKNKECLDKLKYNDLLKLHGHIKYIYEGPYFEAKITKALRTDDQWEYYRMMGVYDLEEQKLLKMALTSLRKEYANGQVKPGSKSGDTHKDKKRSHKASVQPEQTSVRPDEGDNRDQRPTVLHPPSEGVPHGGTDNN